MFHTVERSVEMDKATGITVSERRHAVFNVQHVYTTHGEPLHYRLRTAHEPPTLTKVLTAMMAMSGWVLA